VQPSEVIVNAFGSMKNPAALASAVGLRRPEGLAAVDQAANVDSDG